MIIVVIIIVIILNSFVNQMMKQKFIHFIRKITNLLKHWISNFVEFELLDFMLLAKANLLTFLSINLLNFFNLILF